MDNALPLHQMSTEEKIQIMETIWEDLCKKAANISSPSWHGDILHERGKGLVDESDTFIDWEKAKKRIQDSIS